jgi:hypothetical protein
MIFLAILAAAALSIGLFKNGNPFRAHKAPDMPDPITPSNVDLALRHLAETYGHHDAHDEADGPAPVLVPLPRKRGRPRKTPVPKPAAVPKTAKPKRVPVAVLAGNLRIPAQIRYDRGHHIGEARDVVILGVLGQHGPEGEFKVQTIRCICDKAKGLRAFQLDHITDLADGYTGEIVSNVPAWLDEKLAALV